MSSCIIFNNREITKILAQKIRTTVPSSAVSIARFVNGRLVGGVIFREFTGESIRISLAGIEPHWVDRELLSLVADYAFNQLGVKRIWAGGKADLYPVLAFGQRLGFKAVAEIPGMYPGNVSRIISVLERADCKWLQTKPRTHGRLAA